MTHEQGVREHKKRITISPKQDFQPSTALAPGVYPSMTHFNRGCTTHTVTIRLTHFSSPTPHFTAYPPTHMIVARVKGEELVVCGVFRVSCIGPEGFVIVVPHIVQHAEPAVVRYQDLQGGGEIKCTHGEVVHTHRV